MTEKVVVPQKTQFEKFLETNVNDYTEKKNGLTYLSWVYAWKEFKKVYPNAKYTVKHWDGCPYWYDPVLGYMVETSINSGEEELSMWLPVMDGANKAMKAESYTYKTKYDTKTVQAATMFDINTAIMRCLVKNIAMFGLGLYIYAGEDLPDTVFEPMTNEQLEELKNLGADIDKMLQHLGVDSVSKISKAEADVLIQAKKQKNAKEKQNA